MSAFARLFRLSGLQNPPAPMQAMAVGLQLNLPALLRIPDGVRWVYGVSANHFWGRVRDFQDIGRRIGRFLWGTVIDLITPGLGNNGDVESGQPADTHHSTRQRWVRSTISFVVLVGIMVAVALALGGVVTLPQIRSLYEDLLERVRMALTGYLPFD